MTKVISLLGATGSIGRQTLQVARELGLGVAALTANRQAAAMAQVDMSVREERAARAAAVAERMHQGYLARCVGKSFPVLFEQDRGEGSVGHAPNYMPVTVGMKGLHNTVQNVRITAVDGDGLRGEPEET